MVNKAAQALGRLGGSVSQTYTDDETEKRRKRLVKARKKRWPKKPKK